MTKQQIGYALVGVLFIVGIPIVVFFLRSSWGQNKEQNRNFQWKHLVERDSIDTPKKIIIESLFVLIGSLAFLIWFLFH